MSASQCTDRPYPPRRTSVCVPRPEAERVKQIRRAEANQKFAEFEAKKNRAARQARREKARRPT